MHPKLYVDGRYPEGFGVRYPSVEVSDTKSARNVLTKYMDIEADFVLGIDMRAANRYTVNLFLKFIETTSLKLIILAREPVSPTIISRMAEIHKNVKVEKKSILQILLGEQIIAKKVGELK